MLLELGILFGCLIVLIVGAWCVSEGGDILGDHYDATIVGGFIIAWLNTSPETIFFITALESKNPNFAVGAISGSVIVVCTIAVGLVVLIGGKARQENTIYLLPGVRQQALMLGASLIVLIFVLLFGFKYFLGIMGILSYLGFILWTVLVSKSNQSPSQHDSDSENKDNQDLEKGEETPQSEDTPQPIWKGVSFLLAGGLLIYLFSEPFISAVVSLGRQFYINPIALAFFFAPIASEAPEILEGISLSRKGKTQNINIAFSNLIGGTISKTTLLLGLLCLYSVKKKFQWISPAYTVSMLLVLLCAGATASFGLKAEHSGNKGKILLGIFVICGFVQFIFAYHTGQVLG